MSVTTRDILDIISEISKRIDSVDVNKRIDSVDVNKRQRSIIGSEIHCLDWEDAKSALIAHGSIRALCADCGDVSDKRIMSYEEIFSVGARKAYIIYVCKKCGCTHRVIAIRGIIIECTVEYPNHDNGAFWYTRLKP